ncbi:hypothetical protein MNBD_GAMMA26-803 [hydrothermal vent metagenome]|uniref:Glycosyltransferase n=1 Tax=hydrothermal vent metagenome TaxID=652676 RepID=A0A3B1BWV4_9ZZZZ
MDDMHSSVSAIQISYSDTNGGAARAAFRLHRAFRDTIVDSRMLVQQRQHDDPSIIGPQGKLRAGLGLLRASLSGLPALLKNTSDPTLHSYGWLPSGRDRLINGMGVDVVNLHWVGWDMLSITEIAKIKKPLVWTLHDMWAFCGTEHYAPDTSEARWRLGYTKENRDAEVQGLDLGRLAWQRKRNNWRHSFQIVTPSNWLANCVKNSALMHDWPIEVIPNPLDIDVFKPIDRNFACEALNLPSSRKYVLFGAIGGGKDLRKGFDLLQHALLQLAETWPHELSCIVCGQSEPLDVPDIGFPIIWMGHVHDDWSLALLYNVADVVAVPSRQENLPQMATEAMACGVPVVAFNTTGLPDVVDHKKNGYLAISFDSSDLALGIEWVLEDDNRRCHLGEQARHKAVENWAHPVVAARYRALYESLLTLESEAKGY